ncbi:MAG: hypothetical protein ACI8Z7_000830 [Candidatus Nanohaloarchaea archaeon]|jgi:hypothetical protein
MWKPGARNLKVILAVTAILVAGFYVLSYLQMNFSDTDNFANFTEPADSDFPDFVRADAESGIKMNSTHAATDFVGHSGVYVRDFNRDGWEDVLGVNGNKAVLFENKGGEFEKTGYLSGYTNIASAHFFDYDNSGYEDLLLLRSNDEPVLLKNQVGEGFEQVDAGFDQQLTRPYGAASADYNQDGCLDVFIVQWGGNALYNEAQRVHDHHPDYRPTAETSYPNYFYEGDCESFEKANRKANIGGERYFTFTASFTDFSGNGYPDIYMPNDFGRDIFYRNNGNGSFTPTEIGPASDRNAMSSETGFFNDDSRPDIFVTNVYYPENFTEKHEKQLVGDNVPLPYGNNLFINTEEGFNDQAREYGVRKGGWGWASTFSDFSNNGRQSIVHSTDNRYYDYTAPKLYRRSSIFERTGNGTFRKLNSSRHGMEIDADRGISKIDFNSDGRLDLIKSTQQRTQYAEEQIKLYENTNASVSFLQLVPGVHGIPTNTEVVLNSSEGIQRRLVNSRSDFMSQESQMVHFGLTGDPRSVTLIYPSGDELKFDSVEPNRRYMINTEQESIEVVEQ